VGLGLASMSGVTRGKFFVAFDSATVASKKTPPPAWMERIAPGADATSRAQQAALGPTITRGLAIWGAAMGGILALAIISSMIGTLGWAAGLLLAFAFTGRWIAGSRAVTVRS
jgi:hypothetical protein